MKITISDTVRRFITFLLTVFTLTLSVIFFTLIRSGEKNDDSYVINGPCDLTINSKDYRSVDLSILNFPELVKGDHVVLSFTMPDVAVENAILTFYQDHSAVQVFYNSESVFSKGTPSSMMLGYGYYSIQLPDDYSGDSVKIVYDIIESEKDTSLISPVINNADTYLRNFIIDNSLYLFIDIAIIVLCISIMLMSCIFSGIIPSFKRLVFLGAAFFAMAIWVLCNYDLIRIFTDDLIIKGYMEYCSLYTGPFFLSVYFFYEFFKNAGERVSKTYKVIMLAQGVFPLVAIIFHFLNIVHLPALLPLCHIILIIDVGFMMIVLLRQFFKKDSSHKPMIVGLLVVVILIAFDMVRFIIYKIFFTRYLEDFVSFLLVGFFLFLLMILMDFLMSQKKAMYLVARAEAMERIAHLDILTDLANRRRCEEIFEDITGSGKRFAIISIDINYLKLTNDRYGHQEGDRLLTDLAGMMKKACEDENVTPGRMGGDEFIVIIPELINETDKTIVEKMETITADINKTRKPLPLSFAYGVCRSDEVEETQNESIVEKVYRIADERMYEMKKAMKAGRDDGMNEVR